MDFTSSHTIVWAKNCTQAIGNYVPGSCELNPTLLSSNFDPANNSSGLLIQTGIFENAKFSGYVVSGTKYTTEMCFADQACKLLQVYSGELVTANNWRFNQNGAYGIIGLSPDSKLWSGFVNKDTNIATYSLSLARVKPLTSNALQQASNITIGSANDANYQGQTPMMVQALANYSYALTAMDFGIVYQDGNGNPTSQYFQSIGTPMYPVTFTTSFMGLGLPGDVYAQVTNLLAIISNNLAVCEDSLDGICVMPDVCSSYTGFETYAFKFQFAGSNIFLRVPLATFASNVRGSGGVNQCNIQVTYLDTVNTQSSNIILGGQFFQEFFGVFDNNYNTDPYTQAATIYVNEYALWSAYVGATDLPEGVNPFVPPTPAEEKSKAWIWITILSVVIVLLLGGLGFAIYKWKASQGATASKRELAYNEDSTQPLANNASDDL